MSQTRITQGAFSFLPDLTDDEIAAQVGYALRNGWAISIEHTDDPGPRSNYWSLWGLPMFDLPDTSAALIEVNECRKAHPDQHIRVSAFDASYGRQTTALSFLVNRPQ